MSSRAQVAEALLTHYELTHGTVAEGHDHHCSMGGLKPELPCTCGYQGWIDAIEGDEPYPDVAVIGPDNGCGCSYCRRVAEA